MQTFYFKGKHFFFSKVISELVQSFLILNVDVYIVALFGAKKDLIYTFFSECGIYLEAFVTFHIAHKNKITLRWSIIFKRTKGS